MSATSNNTTPTTCLPPLTLNECTLLTANDGCYKCCCPFTGHHSPDCPDSFPAADTYKPITEASIASAKPRNAKKPVAAVTPIQPAQNIPPVAVVLPNLGSCVLGEGSDSEYVFTPLHTSHYKWDCILGGPHASSETRVSALIDNGSHSVLISPETADHIGLARQQLPIPEEVELAMTGGVKETFTFVEWVPLGIFSSDQTWSS